MEKKEKKTVTATKSEKLAALQIAQAIGKFDIMTTLDDEKYISALTKRAEMILRWVSNEEVIKGNIVFNNGLNPS